MTSLSAPESVTEFLNDNFQIRKIKNPKYSLRAYARDLGMPAGRMSELLSGKRNLTLKHLPQISEALKLSDDVKDKLKFLITKQGSLKSKKYIERNFVEPKDFSKICHWQYYALICLLDQQDKYFSKAKLASKLDLEEPEVDLMLKNLLKVGIISSDGQVYKVIKNSTTTTQDIQDKLIQQFHRDLVFFHMLQIEKIPVEKRDLQSLILSVAAKDIPKAKKFIRNFINDFQKKFATDKSTAVYGLSMQMSPLTKLENE